VRREAKNRVTIHCWYQRRCGAVGVHLMQRRQHEQSSVASLRRHCLVATLLTHQRGCGVAPPQQPRARARAGDQVRRTNPYKCYCAHSSTMVVLTNLVRSQAGARAGGSAPPSTSRVARPRRSTAATSGDKGKGHKRPLRDESSDEEQSDEEAAEEAEPMQVGSLTQCDSFGGRSDDTTRATSPGGGTRTPLTRQTNRCHRWRLMRWRRRRRHPHSSTSRRSRDQSGGARDESPVPSITGSRGASGKPGIRSLGGVDFESSSHKPPRLEQGLPACEEASATSTPPQQQGGTPVFARIHTPARCTSLHPQRPFLRLPGGWAACGVAPLVEAERGALGAAWTACMSCCAL
jgi:hypothetical protein